MRARFVFRVRVLLILFALLAFLFVIRLYFIQVVHGEMYRDEAQSQYVAPAAAVENRGDVFFRDKDGRLVTAATQQSGWLLAIQPNALEDSDAAYQMLSNLVSIDAERFFKSAAKTDDPYEEIAFHIDNETADKITELDIDGVVLARERWRYYPAKERAAHVLGFVGFQGHERVGRYGLERYWQDTLERQQDELYVNFFAEIFSNVRSLVSLGDQKRAGDLITSIEPIVQQRLEEELANISEEWGPKRLGGIVMDPQTGEIVALAALPSFDPNTFNTESDGSVFVNPLVEGVYELGSIMKPLTMAAGLDTGAVTPQTTYNDRGFIMKSGSRISNYDGRGRGVVNMQEVLNQSLNTGVAFVVDEMGEKEFAKYMKSFELGEETGVDLPNEVRGLLSGLESGAEIDYASASFGQGIAVTPIAMTRALAVLANGGELVQPHIVSKVNYTTGLSKTLWGDTEGRVIKKETAQTITDMLVGVVDDALLDGALKQERYSIAAKTGTAEIANPHGGGYYTDRFLHSFFGYFPAHDAQYLVFLFALEPQNVRYASQTLAEPFMDLTKFIINYYEIPPDR